jgi:hypothetical protein
MSHTLRALLAATLLLAAGSASAATISAVASGHGFLPNNAFDVDISLDLGVGEEASVFEGRFDLIGVGTVVQNLGSGDVLAGGPSWDSAFGNIVTSQLLLSLTSSNTGGSRLVGRVRVTGLASGIFQIRLASGTFAQRDIPAPPFVLDVPITTPPGTVLVEVQIDAPQVPALGPAGALALAGALAWTGRRRGRPR